jgi:hypothetical protein
MIYKTAILAAAVLALVAVATGKTIRAQRTVVLNGLKYELKLHSDDSLDVAREDGLHFSVDRNGKIDLMTGTRDQLNDASAQMIRSAGATAGGQR